MALRTGVVLDLRLPPSFWKALSGERLSRSDLEAVDARAVRFLVNLEKTGQELGHSSSEEPTDDHTDVSADGLNTHMYTHASTQETHNLLSFFFCGPFFYVVWLICVFLQRFGRC